MFFAPFVLALTFAELGSAASRPAQESAVVNTKCSNIKTAKVACVEKYASVLPYPFFREVATGNDMGLDRFSQINTTDKSFEKVADADFVFFGNNVKDLSTILGSSPKVEKVFKIPKLVHEGPVYAAREQKIFFSQPALAGHLKQFAIDLKDPKKPTLSEFEAKPPVYSPNGGTFYNGMVYWAQSGGNASLIASDGTVFEAQPGIVTMDPRTMETKTILNNYYGHFFNQVNDLVVDKKGDIWFTDPQYAWFSNLTTTPPALPPATYRFRPSTGAVSRVEDSCVQPNGIALSADQKTLYIADSGSVNGNTAADALGAGIKFDSKRTGTTIYAFDILNGRQLVNKRPIYTSPEWVPDGVKVAKNGLLVTGSGMGVDVIDPVEGVVLMRINTDYTVMNIVFAGENMKDLWIVGAGGVTKVQWELEGVEIN